MSRFITALRPSVALFKRVTNNCGQGDGISAEIVDLARARVRSDTLATELHQLRLDMVGMAERLSGRAVRHDDPRIDAMVAILAEAVQKRNASIRAAMDDESPAD